MRACSSLRAASGPSGRSVGDTESRASGAKVAGLTMAFRVFDEEGPFGGEVGHEWWLTNVGVPRASAPQVAARRRAGLRSAKFLAGPAAGGTRTRCPRAPVWEGVLPRGRLRCRPALTGGDGEIDAERHLLVFSRPSDAEECCLSGANEGSSTPAQQGWPR